MAYVVWTADARDGWQARRVTLDGVSVGERTQAIHFRGEEPIAVTLYAFDANGLVGLLAENGDLVVETVRGPITVAGLRRIGTGRLELV
jgi:hypothetical protein